jgi:hypothetical protein
MARKTKRRTLKRKQKRTQKGRGLFTPSKPNPCTIDTTQLFKDAKSAGESVLGCYDLEYEETFLTPERRMLLDTLRTCPAMQNIDTQLKHAFMQSCEQKESTNAAKLQARAARVRKMKYGTNTTRRANLVRQEGKRNLFTF